ncbi:MAG: Sapep family Mn(2+)-dependent dipeptidase [Clostridiales bacterium]|nr:Sapep family Mn(2+)-dependent dipeptidase [Clostridiales bacterium]
MKDAKKLLNEQFDELVSSLQKVISFNTEKGVATSGAPFGKNIKDCLDYTLGLASSMGLTTYNCDGYAGHADWVGSTNEVLGILGHLDVVPAKAEEWLYPPYAAEIHDGKLYGRGTMDDKGPMIACLYAVKALKEAGFKPSKTVRLIFGCDEESGMQCVEHYFSKMPYPTVSFSPDGDFPVINREKGIYQFDVICGKLPKGVQICAGERANVVPSLCTATAVEALKFGEPITCEKTATGYTYTATGKSAHGSTPDEGINATHALLKMLAQNYPDNATLRFLADKVIDTTGLAWGVNLCDKESGKLTCNLGVLRTAQDGTVTATVDIRFPVTYTCDQMYQILREHTPAQFEIVPEHISEPLFVPSDSKLVTTLMQVYNGEMKVNLEPLAIGGGTYSRCLPNCVAFGPLFPDEEQTIHMPNECVDLVNLRKMAELYLEAIYQLAK